MDKSIIITGPRGCGKTTKSKELASMFDENEVVFIDSIGDNIKNPFAFSECTQKTKLIVWEEIKSLSEVESFFNLISDGVFVNKLGQTSFLIRPKFVLVCKPGIFKKNEITSLSIQMRFNLIEMS
jgi:predicted AAA+ superfamily ATPase